MYEELDELTAAAEVRQSIHRARLAFIEHTGQHPDTVYLGHTEYDILQWATVFVPGDERERVFGMAIVIVASSYYVGAGRQTWPE